MPFVNPFLTDNAFVAGDLTEAINKIPPLYGRIGQLGLFAGRGTPNTVVFVEQRDGKLGLIPAGPRGRPPYIRSKAKRSMRAFEVPHIKQAMALRPEDIQDVRTMGSETQLVTQAEARADALMQLRSDADITIEWQRAGAIQGTLLDADGTEMVNFFTEFGITEKTVNFALTTGSTKVVNKAREVHEHIAKNLLGDTMTGMHALASPSFFQALITHESVEASYLNWQAAAELRANNRMSTGEQFYFGGILWEEYFGEVTQPDGTVVPLIPANTARIFPVGTRSTFFERWAPADYWDEANKIGTQFYSKEYWEDNREASKILEIQTNNFPYVARPEVLVKATISG